MAKSCNSDNCKQYCDLIPLVVVILPEDFSCNSDNCKQYCDSSTSFPANASAKALGCNSDNCKQYCDGLNFSAAQRYAACCNSDN